MLKGGKVVGKGTYGCVYNPPMKCKGETIREDDTISKLMDKTEAVKEVTEMSVIDNIDPEYEFHVELRRICDPGAPIKGIDYRVGADGKIINKCPMMDDVLQHKNMSRMIEELNKKNLKLVKYEDGGQNLATFIGNEIGSLDTDPAKSAFFLRLFLSMENLFKGLVVMDRHEFCHFDIKLENIVIKPQTDGERFTLKYIDFGMSRNYKEIPSRGVFKNSYFAWPLETMMFVPGIYNTIASDSAKDTMLSAFNRSFSAKIANQTIDSRTLDPYTKTVNDPRIFSNYLRDIDGEGGPKKDKYEMFQEMTSKIDTFSLGIVLLECWANILKIFFYNDDATDVLLDTFTHREIFDEIQELILNMIRPYYGIRYNAEQAYAKFLSIKGLILGEDEFKALRVSGPEVLSGMESRLSQGSPDIVDDADIVTDRKKQTKRRQKTTRKPITPGARKTRKRKVTFKNTPLQYEYTPDISRGKTNAVETSPIITTTTAKQPTKITFFSKYISPESSSASSMETDSDEVPDVTSYLNFVKNQKQRQMVTPSKGKQFIIPDSGTETDTGTGTESESDTDTDTDSDTETGTPLFLGKTVLSGKPGKKALAQKAKLQSDKDKLLKRTFATDPFQTKRFNIPTMPSQID